MTGKKRSEMPASFLPVGCQTSPAKCLPEGHIDYSLTEQKPDKQNHHGPARFWQPRALALLAAD